MNDNYQTLILGGGLSGLTVAHKLRLNHPQHKFLIIEKSDRAGGVISSNNDQGFISEKGPHGFLDNCAESKSILRETGLDKECIKAPLIDFVRYVYLNGRLNLIPQTPRKILMAPLIPWHAKLRVLADLWKAPLKGEPTVAKWAQYRFGPALLPYLDAVYTGTYAGDFNKLTIDSVMPGVRALEKEHGSVIRGLITSMKAKKKRGGSGKKLTMPAMTSFPKGMERLSEKLSESLVVGRDILFNSAATGIKRQDKEWIISTSETTYKAKNIVLCLPINACLRLLGPIAADLPEKDVPETRISTVVFGFTDDVTIPPGFGFLTPEVEKRFTLGSLFSSNMFPGRAPEGHVVFETLVGGRRHPERLELDDEKLTEEALTDVRDILGIKEKPVYSTLLRPSGSIPQLERNYPALLSWKENFVEENKGLHLCGFGWGGIGLNDMMKSATMVAEELISSRQSKQETEVKGVYF
ncbi:MAG: protoporphyrinogen oxidase [Desulfobulbaceae bacterium]|nr:protoporphyrinogen oxidase [Desulfobulbaceae bacterium]